MSVLFELQGITLRSVKVSTQ